MWRKSLLIYLSSPVCQIAQHTLKEISSQKVFYALTAFAFFIFILGVLLAPLSLNEHTRLSINFSLTACHISFLSIAIYFAAPLLVSDKERGTAAILFTKALSRWQFILGRSLGLLFVLLLIAVCMLLFLCLLFSFYAQPISQALFVSIWGIALEAFVLMGITMLFSLLLPQLLTFFCTFQIFLIGHLVNGFIVLKEEHHDALTYVFNIALHIFPNFEKMNWRTEALYGDFIPYSDILWGSVLAFSWTLALFLLSMIIFERKSIV